MSCIKNKIMLMSMKLDVTIHPNLAVSPRQQQDITRGSFIAK